MEPIALTIPDAVKASGASRTAIYVALRRGELSARKHGKRTLIEAEALKAWLARMPAYEPARAA
ncbi:MAG: helix-turn-helix domain-containing protein [Telmatospirillum sp.]|nr:helix-turn-helix domain-containing protein [Telmatospirillum sp.]